MIDEALAVELDDVERLQHAVLLYDLLCLHGERFIQALVLPHWKSIEQKSMCSEITGLYP